MSRVTRVRRTPKVLWLPFAAALALACGDGGTNVDPWVVQSVEVVPDAATIDPGATVKLQAVIVDEGTPGTPTWRSSKTQVAIVDDQGLVTAIAPGETLVTVTAGGKQASSTITVSAPIPEAPSGVEAEPLSDTSVEVGWTSNSEFETEFRIERAVAETGGAGGGADAAAGSGPVGAETFEPAGTVGAGVTTFVDHDLEPATAYLWRVQACNATGCSGAAGPAGAETDETLVVATTSLAGAVIGQAYEATVEAAGGGTPIAWRVASGQLPPGLELHGSTGVIDGTPTTEGTFPFEVEVTSRGQSVTVDLEIGVGGGATLSAVVFRDDDRDGVHDGGEAGVADVEVSVLHAGDGSLAATATSGPDGTVETPLAPGTYRIALAPMVGGGLIGDPAVLDVLELELQDGPATEAELPMVPGAQGEIGPAGGVLEAPDGSVLTVPAGALDAPTVLSLVPTDVAFDGGSFPGVDLYPAGLVFDVPVELSMEVGAGGDGGRVFFVDGEVALMEATRVEGGTASAWIGHFSEFFYDEDWGDEGALGAGSNAWAIVAVPTLLAAPGTAAEARADVERAVERWRRVLEAAGIGLARSDAAPSPALRVAVRDLGACDPGGASPGRRDRLAALSRDGVLYLNDACVWSTSNQLAAGGEAGAAIEGAVAHHLGHALGLGHAGGAACETGTSGGCSAPPTMAVNGEGDLGPLWPGDLSMAAAELGLSGSPAGLGVASIEPAPDWTDGEVVAAGTSPATQAGVRVLDGGGSPVPDVTVLFQVLSGNSLLTGRVAVTGADGIARLGSWTAGSSPGEHVVGASFFHQPSRTAANQAVGALVELSIEVPAPPTLHVEDFLPLAVGQSYAYTFTSVPKDGGDPVTGEGTDQITAESEADGVTWFLYEGDGPFGSQCGGATCEVGLNLATGEAILRVTGESVIRTRPLKEPIEAGRSWTDIVVITFFRWSIPEIFPSLEVGDVTYDTVVQVRGSVTGVELVVYFHFARDVGLVRLVIDGPQATTTYDLVEVTGG